MYDAFPDRIMVSPVLPVLIKAGRLGQKTAQDFSNIAPGKDRGEADPALAKYLTPMIRGQQKFSQEQITVRLFLPMLLEATRLLDDKIVRERARRRSGFDFWIGISAVQRWIIVLGGHSRRGEDFGDAEAIGRAGGAVEADTDAGRNGADGEEVLSIRIVNNDVANT